MKEYVNELRTFFDTKTTFDVKYRINQLERLEEAINKYEVDILNALKLDLNKSPYESYLTEISTVLMEIKFIKKRLKKWTKPRKVKTPITHFPAKSYIYPEPYGVVLIISPWNYPFQLSMMPLVGAISAGNCALIKPSERSSATSKIIEKIISDTFSPDYVKVVLGSRAESQNLLQEKFDLIFFTGSVNVGKLVMQSASHHLTPVILELGGKSPCIVDKTADLKLASKRIVWGKMLNLGQTCVAPDYVLVHNNVKDEFIAEVKKVVNEYYSDHTKLPKIITKQHYERLSTLISSSDVIFGGEQYEESNQIGFTLVDGNWDSEIMKDEIFGPVLPLIEYDDINNVVSAINEHPKPLALYLFTNDKKIENIIIQNVSFGGGSINDTIMHLASPYLPFGGVGNSGMGSYHGKKSFDAFSHFKSILKKSRYLDLALRYPPYDKDHKKLKKFIK